MLDKRGGRRMTKIESQTEHCTEFCRSCTHFGFCLVDWGTKCKCQGGKEIPRMRTNRIKAKKKENKQVVQKPQKPRKQIIEIFEPIRTKMVYW